MISIAAGSRHELVCSACGAPLQHSEFVQPPAPPVAPPIAHAQLFDKPDASSSTRVDKKKSFDKKRKRNRARQKNVACVTGPKRRLTRSRIYSINTASGNLGPTCDIVIVVTPYFNLATTTAFIDPFRAANYLAGESHYKWTLVSGAGGEVVCSNGLSIQTRTLAEFAVQTPDTVVVSSSWTPEVHHTKELTKALTGWAQRGVRLGALDTGTFILARAKLLKNCRATVHYEHLDALSEQFPDITACENLFVIDADRFSGCGGSASTDLALQLLHQKHGGSLANSVARYLFHHKVRGADASQNPIHPEPFGQTTPALCRRAIQMMEDNLELPLSIPEICTALSVSQRKLNRQFRLHVSKSAVEYYRDIRLDRARCLVTQTELKLTEIAIASGFASQTHFTRAYGKRFGLPPSRDRIAGRVPFEFRAWPMYSPSQVKSDSR